MLYLRHTPIGGGRPSHDHRGPGGSKVRLWSSLWGLALGAALLLPAGAAYADDPKPDEQAYPVVYAERPLTLSQTTLHLYGSFDATRLVKAQTAGMTPLRELETRLNIDAGAAFGI